MLISGKHVDASDQATIKVINPATGELLDTVPVATAEDVNAALENSLKGQKEWGSWPLHKREKVIRKFIDLVDEHLNELGEILSKEMGKPIKQAIGEFKIIRQLFGGFIETANNTLGTTLPIGVYEGKEKDIEFTIREPLGTIVCIVPFNSPVSLWSHKVAPALVAGNAVICKLPSDNPLHLLRLGGLMLEAGIPGNAIQFLTGSGSKLGKLLVEDPRVAKVSFTGSTEVGYEIAKMAAKNLTSFGLELGGNAPQIVLDDADVDLAVSESVVGRIFNNGQICAAPKRFLVHRSLKNEFRDKLIEQLKKIVIGDPLDPNTQVGTLISEKAAKEVEEQVYLTVKQGAKLVYGGERNGAYYIPAVLDEVTRDMDVAHDMEIFGPVFPIIAFDTIEEAIEIANDTIYGLCSGVFTKDMKKAMKVAQAMQAGSVTINGDACYRNLLSPFGGYKKSGIGREGLTITLEELTQVKSIILKGILE
jgi:acyl-CoA reductase-like NAD-dependent aldehyde dehydrogenase